jgi:hypothetical protein
MAKFSHRSIKTAFGLAPTATTSTKTSRVSTFEGDAGHALDAKSELFTLALTNLVGEHTFYEDAPARDGRFAALVHEVTTQDPGWLAGLVPFLRDTVQLRSVSIVAAAEYAVAGGPNARQVISAALQRADEPAEMLGYWLAVHGRALPMAVKRGIADGARRLYTERAALKWDGASRGIRMADVIELTHPKPVAPWQSALFKHLLDKRHGHFTLTGEHLAELGTQLPIVASAHRLDTVPGAARRELLRTDPDVLREAGYTWERLSGWLPANEDGVVLDAEAWASIIPSMGYMALLRNLRNFEHADVDSTTLGRVAAKLADPAEVAASRQFPYRFWSAYKHSGSVLFGPELEQALQHSLANVPALPGRSLVLIDTSGSMQTPISGHSGVQAFEIGAVFASAVANAARRGGGEADLVLYATGSARQTVHRSVLRTVHDIASRIGEVGHGTDTWINAQRWYDGHDRVFVFTDMQDHPGNSRAGIDRWSCPVYVWDLRGCGKANLDTGRGRYLFAGFTDAAFRLIPLLEAGRDAAWPWESVAAGAA